MDILSGERHEVLVDGDVSFSLNLVRIGSEQFKIGQQTSRNRILDCHDDGICPSLPDGREQPAESGTFDNGDVFTVL